MACFVGELLCIFTGVTLVYGLQSSWGHRGFQVQCDRGLRLNAGHTLASLPGTRSRSRCLARCFAHADCRSVSYHARDGVCVLSASTKEASGATEDGDYTYCGPESDWERAAIIIELPTTTMTPTTLEPNECDSQPCQNGDCTDGLGHFTCSCSPGYEGTLCEINYNECSSNPCVQGTCADGINGFTCSCTAGFSGTLCHINTNECGSNPCQYGVCQDHINSFTCSCTPGYSGTLCQSTESSLYIRLVNGPTSNEGRVEVLHNGVWGTVCDDFWDLNDGHAACRQLGYSSAATADSYAANGQGTGTIWLDDVGCTGTESSLEQCYHLGWGAHNCAHTEDASVKCI